MRACILLCAVALLGCGTSATITRNGGTAFDAKIVDSDAEFLHLESDEHGAGLIRRDVVREIDHPGNVAATIGSVLLGFGVAMIAGGVAMEAACSSEDSVLCELKPVAFMIVPGSAYAAVGLGTAIYGYVVWGGSAWRAGHTEGAPSPYGLPLGRRPTQLKLSF